MARAVAIVIGLLALGTAPLAAQNLVLNPHFASDILGWGVITPPLGISWSGALDSNGSACSGVLVATLVSPTPISTLAGQCITGISDLITYDFGIDVLVPPGEPVDGFSNMRVDWFAGPGCTSYLGTAAPFGSVPPPSGAWVTMAISGVAPPVGTSSAGVLLVVGRAAGGGAYDTMFDDAYFAPTGTFDDLIFADGFDGCGPLVLSIMPRGRPGEA